jgi:hypothetical protein
MYIFMHATVGALMSNEQSRARSCWRAYVACANVYTLMSVHAAFVYAAVSATSETNSLYLLPKVGGPLRISVGDLCAILCYMQQLIPEILCILTFHS